ncbi:MAG: hypothetical protein JST68_25315 [Bacteroidetes bacterium]|nr:hypothetical protein [Bacteroidota bacterium]
MCQFKSCYAGENGYIVRCEDCQHFQVGFGTTVLTLNAYDFQAFLGIVAYKKENHQPIHDPNTRSIVLPTPCSTVHLIFSENELADLHIMLQEADNELRTQEMLRLFK